MAEVIRWSTGEEMMNPTLGEKGSLSCCLACLSSLFIHTLAHSTALIHPGMGRHNRCCIETKGTTFLVKYFRSAGN